MPRAVMLSLALVLGAVLPAVSPAVRAQDEQITLTVSAAADLTPAFEEIGALFERRSGVAVDFNFGSTGQLAEQIEAGAPVDLFAAANVSYIDQLDAKGLILPDTKATYARGRIVVWTRPDGPLAIDDIADLTDPRIARVAIANPEHVPYGVAARDAMRSAGVWDAVLDKLVLGENVRDTLRFAETGNVDVALVALSLAIQGDGRWTLIPEDLHAPIDQALAVIGATEHEPEARAFADLVNGDQGREIMRRYGFVLPGETISAATLGASPVASSAGATPVS